jgi:hypothetical protein
VVPPLAERCLSAWLGHVGLARRGCEDARTDRWLNSDSQRSLLAAWSDGTRPRSWDGESAARLLMPPGLCAVATSRCPPSSRSRTKQPATPGGAALRQTAILVFAAELCWPLNVITCCGQPWNLPLVVNCQGQNPWDCPGLSQLLAADSDKTILASFIEKTLTRLECMKQTRRKEQLPLHRCNVRAAAAGGDEGGTGGSEDGGGGGERLARSGIDCPCTRPRTSWGAAFVSLSTAGSARISLTGPV